MQSIRRKLGIALLILCATSQNALSQDPNNEDSQKTDQASSLELFYKGDYEKCIKVTEAMLLRLPKPSKSHEPCLFALAASKHYLGLFMEAQPLLNDYLATYKDKPGNQDRLMAALYFQAANYSRLMEWPKSAALFKQFLKQFPNPEKNAYFSYALFDLANCYYAKNELDTALVTITRVEKEFPKIAIIEQALTLKGNLFEGIRKNKKAEEYYLKALAIAGQKNNDIVAAESLFYLVALIGREPVKGEPNPRIAEAIPYYNLFWKKYGHKSPFNAKVAVAGIPAMRQAGKIDEALKHLQSAIASIAQIPDSPGLEEAIGSYTDEFLKEHTLEELKEHYYHFPGVEPKNYAAQALLRIAVIAAHEDLIESAQRERNNKKTIKAKVINRVLFKELQSNFKLKDLSGFILVKMGDFIRLNEPKPENARIYYEELLNRPGDQPHEFHALYGLAALSAKGNDTQKLEAIKQLKRIMDDSDDTYDKERALHLTATIHADRGDHDSAITSAKLYLAHKSYRRYSTDCRMLLASSHEKAGRVDDALAAYLQVWSTNMGKLKFSTPAMQNWMNLLWKRNRGSDRQLAVKRGQDFIKLTSNAVKRATATEQAQWKELSEHVENLGKKL